MNELFKRHRARLTEAEDKKMWESVRAGTVGSARRRWSLFGAPMALVGAAAAIAVAVVVVNHDGAPTDQLSAFRAKEAADDSAAEAPRELYPGTVEAEPSTPEATERVHAGARTAEAAIEKQGAAAERDASNEKDEEAAWAAATREAQTALRQRMEPERPEPAQSERARPERAQPERAQPERAQPERAQPERAQPEPAQSEPKEITDTIQLTAGDYIAPRSGQLNLRDEQEGDARADAPATTDATPSARARRMLTEYFDEPLIGPIRMLVDTDTLRLAIGRTDAADAQIRGRIVDAKSSMPMAYTNVIIPGTPWGAMTHEDGTFAIGYLSPDELRRLGIDAGLRAAFVGYEPTDVDSLPLDAGALVAVEIGLRPKPEGVLALVEVSADRQKLVGEAAAQGASGGTDDVQSQPVEEITDAIALKAGVVARSGQLRFHGGREGEVPLMLNEPPPAPAPNALTPASREREPKKQEQAEERGRGLIKPPFSTGPISVGGSSPVNDKKIDAMFFQHYGVNPFVDTARDALATFAMDVDNASYTLARSYLQRGVLPPADAIRVEEFVNAFDHGYAPPRGDDVADVDPRLTHESTFAIHLDAAPSPLHANTVLMRVGLKGREVAAYDRKPLNLTFVIDVSGSMEREGRLELVKDSLIELLYRLNADDQVAIVAYSNSAWTFAPSTSVRDRWALERAIQGLAPRGGTNAEAGLRLGYQLAEQAYDPREENRVILCSDGVANIGKTGPESILREIKRCAGRGICMTAIGVGMGNYNDVLLEQIANDGDGNYYYIDSPREAHRVLVENMTGTLLTIARDAKIQVEFDPAAVRSYRLLGYENRDVRDEDFRNDAIDAGEVGAGHEVTALFEVVLDRRAERRAKVAVVRIRFEDPDTGEVTEDYDTFRMSDIARSFDRTPVSFRLDAAVAGFAEILRGSYWAKDDALADVIDVTRDVARDTRAREDVVEVLSLMQTAERLWPDATPVPWRDREREWMEDDD